MMGINQLAMTFQPISEKKLETMTNFSDEDKHPNLGEKRNRQDQYLERTPHF